jgi:hypothetical protein
MWHVALEKGIKQKNRIRKKAGNGILSRNEIANLEE